jgi:hypothetical protein
MKKLLFLLFTIFISQFAFSQNANDALLISRNGIYGSARMTSMGGAFTALGGDLSAMQLNPASGAVFLDSQVSLSYGLSGISNNSTFYNGTGEDKADYNNLNQIGIVFVIDNSDAYSSIIKYALGFNYNRTNNYNENISFKGNNNTHFDDSIGEGIYYDGDLMYDGYSSIATSFVLSANGYAPTELRGAEELAFYTYLIDMNIPIDPSNPDEGSIYYDSRYPTYTDEFPVYVMSAIPNNLLQDYTMNRTGYSGQYNFSASLDVNNKFYLGISYDRSNFNTVTNTKLTETGFTANSEVQALTYESYVSTYGTGNGFSIGGIYKATDFIRIGATYHSPTWYEMNDEYSYKLSIINKTFPNESESTEILYSDYEITTPSKIDAGIAFLFGKNGLISADYEYINYSSMSLEPNNYFEYENEEIKTTMASTHNIKVGTEWKVSFISLRAGYAYSQSPYKNKDWQSDTHTFSFGTGLNFKIWKLDLAYQASSRNYDYYIYDTNLVDAANINRTSGNFVATLRFTM